MLVDSTVRWVAWGDCDGVPGLTWLAIAIAITIATGHTEGLSVAATKESGPVRVCPTKFALELPAPTVKCVKWACHWHMALWSNAQQSKSETLLKHELAMPSKINARVH